MDNLKTALEIIESIPSNASKKEIYDLALKAYKTSNKCDKAIIILASFEDDFFKKEELLIEGLNNVKDKYEIEYELAQHYYKSGMYKKALLYFEELYALKKEYKVVYYLMYIYCLFEDDKINDLYKDGIENIDDICFVRLAFTYLIYLYKQSSFSEVTGLIREINKLNPYIIKILCKEEINETTTIVKEAYAIINNNSMLLKTCGNLVGYLVSVC